MSLFSSKELSGKETPEDRCQRCNARPLLIYRMIDPLSGKTVRMFECKCGERILSDDR
jgi:DNA-directed RNA polymerase subunit RPC12/RpoP